MLSLVVGLVLPVSRVLMQGLIKVWMALVAFFVISGLLVVLAAVITVVFRRVERRRVSEATRRAEAIAEQIPIIFGDVIF